MKTFVPVDDAALTFDAAQRRTDQASANVQKGTP